MIRGTQIKPDAQVVCSKDVAFATVDHMEGSDEIKLKKDAQGQHHYIPLSWVTSVDDKVHIDRPGKQAMSKWSTSPKAVSAAKTGSNPKAANLTTEKAAQDRATSEGMKAPPVTSSPKSGSESASH